jgi:hypothetical protein
VFTPLIAPPGFAEAHADGDFRGSFTLQSDADVLRALKLGMTAPGFSCRDSIEALIFKADPSKYGFVAGIQGLSILGANDPEGKPGQITILVQPRYGFDHVQLLSELGAYLNEPCRRCLSAKIELLAPSVYNVQVNIQASGQVSEPKKAQKVVADAINAVGFTNSLHSGVVMLALARNFPTLSVKSVTFDYLGGTGLPQIQLETSAKTVVFAAEPIDVRFC